MNLLPLIQSSFRELPENLAREVWREPKDLGFVQNVTKSYNYDVDSENFLEIEFVITMIKSHDLSEERGVKML